jgi:hypothetical protein
MACLGHQDSWRPARLAREAPAATSRRASKSGTYGSSSIMCAYGSSSIIIYREELALGLARARGRAWDRGCGAARRSAVRSPLSHTSAVTSYTACGWLRTGLGAQSTGAAVPVSTEIFEYYFEVLLYFPSTVLMKFTDLIKDVYTAAKLYQI